MSKPHLVIHGGVYENEFDPAKIEGLQSIAPSLYEELADGVSACEIACCAVYQMEANPTFNAGCGSFCQTDGVARMDAACMSGTDLSAGAVISVRGVSHPISIADHLRTDSPTRCILAGDHAVEYARRERIAAGFQDEKSPAEVAPPHQETGDTVGAIALDCAGRIAVAISTGGTPDSPPGRVGDVPLIGCGSYADDERGAACLTGVGEHFLRTCTAFRTVNMLVDHSPQEAIERSLWEGRRRVAEFEGGGMALSTTGELGFASCQDYLYVVAVSPHGLFRTTSSNQRRI